MPRYEFSSGRSNKFWEIEVDGSSYTVTYGRIGTAGQTRTKSFSDPETALKRADAAAKKKLAKGYVLIEQAALEAAEEERDDRLVLADELQEAGDPRGELIAIQAELVQTSGTERAALRDREKALLSEHATALLGPLADPDAQACSAVEWKWGFIDRLKLASDYEHQDVALGELLEAVLKHPSAAKLDHLHLGIPDSVWVGESSWQAMLDALAEVGAPALTSLEVADYDDNAEISWCEIGDLSAVWAAVPKLETVTIRGVGITLGTVDSPTLRTLVIESGGLPAEPVRAMSTARCPALEHLELYLGTEWYGASSTVEDCAGILDGSRLPALRTLGLKNGEIMDDLARALVTAPIVKQLKVLDLSMGTMTDDGARAILDHAEAFRHLERLDLSENYLSSEVAAAFAEALPQAVTYSQKDAYEWGDEPDYYTSVAE